MKTILKFIAFFIYTISIFFIYDIRILILVFIIQTILARYSSYITNRCNKNNRKINAIYFIYGSD